MILPKYLKEVIDSSGVLQACKDLSVLSLIYSTDSLPHFRSTPLVHWSVVVCRPFKSIHGTIISQRGCRGWVSLPSSKMTTVSLTCLWKKCTLIAILISDRPLHPSTRNFRSSAAVDNNIRYVCGSPSGGGGGVSHFYVLPDSMSC